MHFIRKLIIVIFFRRICFLYLASRRNYIIRSINRSRVSLFFWISWQWQRCWWTCSTYARTTSWWATETTGSKKVMSIIIFLPLSSLIRYTFLAEILLSLYLSISLYIYIYIYTYQYFSSYFIQSVSTGSSYIVIRVFPLVPRFFMLERLTDWRECTYVIPFPIPNLFLPVRLKKRNWNIFTCYPFIEICLNNKFLPRFFLFLFFFLTFEVIDINR